MTSSRRPVSVELALAREAITLAEDLVRGRSTLRDAAQKAKLDLEELLAASEPASGDEVALCAALALVDQALEILC